MQDQYVINKNESISLFDVFQLLKFWVKYFLTKWWLILIVGAAFGAAGIFYASLSKVQYESRITFSLEDNGGGAGGGLLSLASEFGLSMGGGSDIFAGENILTIFTSRRIIESTLLYVDSIDNKKVTLAEEFLDITGKREGLKENPRLKNISFPAGLAREKFSYLQDSLLFLLYDEIKQGRLIAYKPDKKLNQYEIKIISPNERYSKVFVEELVKQTNSFYTELRTKHSKQTLDVLEQRAASIKGTANAAITQRLVQQDANINPVYATPAQIPGVQKEMDIRVYGGAYGELFKNLEIARIQYLKDMPLLQIIDGPVYPMKRIKMGKLKTGIIFGFVGGVAILILLVVYKQFRDGSLQKKEHN